MLISLDEGAGGGWKPSILLGALERPGGLVFNPSVDICSLEPPLPSDLESRDLGALGHRIDGLFSHLQKRGYLRQG